MYIEDIKFKEGLASSNQEVMKQLDSEKEKADNTKKKYEEKLREAKEENEALLHKNAQLKIFSTASIHFIKQDKIGFVGFLMTNGFLDLLSKIVLV